MVTVNSQGGSAPVGNNGAGSGASPPFHWRWYHFYFLLALFDVLVIVASIWVHHQTLRSFDKALADVVDIHQSQQWLVELQTALIALNAPGNNIFETRAIAAERGHFKTARENMRILLADPPASNVAPTDFAESLERMVEAEQYIFGAFEATTGVAPESDEARRVLSDASRAMASMDRAQAEAMASLTSTSLNLARAQQGVLSGHRAVLDQHTRVEILFIAVVALILAGVFWYGRKLQRTHERLEEEMRRVESERRRRLATVGEVCFACAHGIRNPVAAIASSAQLICEYGQVDGESRQRATDIVTTCDRLTERIARLLAYARTPSINLESLRATDVLEQAFEEVRSELEGRNITVNRVYEAREARVLGERNLLVQALIELMSNAIDHLPDGGTVTLICTGSKTDPRYVELGVADTGSGIPDDIKARVCDLFFTQKPTGHGIGLASAHRTAELHGGSVLVGDADPHGADMRIRIPLA